MLTSDHGIMDVLSNHSVDQTAENLKEVLGKKGACLFALVDHSGEAEKVGMKMPSTKLLLFGSPRAGTPIMLVAPSIAIDLPLKILVWEDTYNRVWMSYNSLEFLHKRHDLTDQMLQKLAIVETIVAESCI